MTEYWKSYAKKFCDVCKCWITDNKASVQFHESGKRHKENVGKKINELVKKATRDNKEKKQLDADMKKMEEAALEAYMKDIDENPDYSSQYVKEKLEALAEQQKEKPSESSKAKPERSKGGKAKGSKNVKDPGKGGGAKSYVGAQENNYVSSISPDRVWYEALSEQGHTYYWNTLTSESAWEAPEGYVSLKEQKKGSGSQKSSQEEFQRQISPLEEEQAREKSEEIRAVIEREKMREKYASRTAEASADIVKKEPKEEVDEGPETSCLVGPKAKIDPYGGWTTVVKQEVKPVDLQLPPSYRPLPQPTVFTSNEPKVKIKEKTIDPSALDYSGGPTNFKKRKFTQKGNTRQRFDDDDDDD